MSAIVLLYQDARLSNTGIGRIDAQQLAPLAVTQLQRAMAAGGGDAVTPAQQHLRSVPGGVLQATLEWVVATTAAFIEPLLVSYTGEMPTAGTHTRVDACAEQIVPAGGGLLFFCEC